jgi:microcystin degradation protein MlrC
MNKRRCKRASLALFLVFPFSFCSITFAADKAGVGGANDQTVVVKGAVTNSATAGATARINIGAVNDAKVAGSNRQKVMVGGSVTNSASGHGSKSEINIGAVNGAKQ